MKIDRGHRINIICGSIIGAIKKNKLWKYDILVKTCCEKYSVSDRSAKEYIDQAMFQSNTCKDSYGFVVETQLRDRPKLE